ncbi:Hsp70 family protein [Candidatus Uabimicrobium sp. HlEnr_7]|uniref:Hsp70 family protein n=1 Tax=Candidatus Uabimicrobium helgolandensis TaxID=3095367 RepID=UPI003558A234
MDGNYIIGIDLGTTNSVVAYKKKGSDSPIELFEILQLTKEGHTEERKSLPSFLYIPGEHDLNKKQIALPWNKSMNYCCGELARKQGNKVPGRMISSAKSWLSHQQVNREEKLLPFQGDSELEKISPVEASTRYLLHIKESWNHQFRKEKKAAFSDQDIYLTVPASFDAVARELTVKAAKAAGIEVTLLEEPQSAFYAWLYQQGESWRNKLQVGDIVLVVDIGGGTSDFCLVSVEERDGNLELNRVAVGNHILLGGDNIDLALAHLVSSKLPKAKLDPWQSLSLWYSCCEAKEKLFSDPSLAKTNVAILGRSSSLIGGTLKAKLTKEELENIAKNGFFPEVDINNLAIQKHKVGLMQMGLPYATEPAITKHIANFLKQNSINEELLCPTAVLFNGGVFKADILQEQVVSVINSWLPDSNLKKLQSKDLDTSVAIGAVYYGAAKYGEGIRIRGGVGRSYYLGIESAMPAIPGVPAPLRALCVIPNGMEEGSESDVPGTELGLVVGEPVEFPFFSSNTRKQDEIGNDIESVDELESSSPLETILDVKDGVNKGDMVPVKLHSKVTEVGTLEISCRTTDNKHNWDLQFNVRKLDQ